MTTLLDILHQRAVRQAEKVCLQVYSDSDPEGDGLALSYQELFNVLLSKSRSLAADFDLKPGQTVAVLADNCPEYLLLTFAAIFCKLRVLLISTKTTGQHLQSFLQKTQSKVLFTGPGQRAEAEAQLADLQGLGLRLADIGWAAVKKSDFSVSAEDCERFVNDSGPTENDCALILHTSGTGNMPKLVPLSHKNILANQAAADTRMKDYWTSDDRSLCWLPLYHGYALLTDFFRDIYVGATCILYQSEGVVKANALLRAIDRTGANILCCVPWMLNLFREVIKEEEAGGESIALPILGGLKFIVTGGSRLDPGLGDFLQERNVVLVTFFGLTEASGCVMSSDFNGRDRELLIPNSDKNIQFVQSDSAGGAFEMQFVDSDLIAEQAYAGSDSQAAAAGTQKLFCSGDLFEPEGGAWRYLGRSDLIYNGPHGEKVNPVLFEAALTRHEAVENVFVYGEQLLFNTALVELVSGAGGEEALLKELSDYVQNVVNPGLEMPSRVYPNDLIFLPAEQHIPLTPKGSVAREEAGLLLKRMMTADLGGTRLEPLEIKAVVLREIESYLESIPENLAVSEKSLLALGFDSLMVFSLRNSLQEKLGLDIPVDMVLSFPTLQELIKDLQELAARPESAGQKAQEGDVDQSGEWRNVQLEQVIFHSAIYNIPLPVFNVSTSMLAPLKLNRQEVESVIACLEQKHDILRSVYDPGGRVRISSDGFAGQALLCEKAFKGEHDLNRNPQLQKAIQDFLLERFDLNNGPVYRYALIHVTDESNLTRTLVYFGLSHIVGDFKCFHALMHEMMQLLHGGALHEPGHSDRYLEKVPAISLEAFQRHQQNWLNLLSVPMPGLSEDVNPRAGKKLNFSFPAINLKKLSQILGEHDISLFNGVYGIYILALCRHLPDLSLQNFPSITCVTSRVSAQLEDLMGCFIHTPVMTFELSETLNLLDLMKAVQETTRREFRESITEPVDYVARLAQDPRNRIPFLTRNVFLYRSPEEIHRPPTGWRYYRNEYFFEQCDVGLYFDFCASLEDGSMEGYILVNLNYASADVLNPILNDIEILLNGVLTQPDLDFDPRHLLEWKERGFRQENSELTM